MLPFVTAIIQLLVVLLNLYIVLQNRPKKRVSFNLSEPYPITWWKYTSSRIRNF